MTAIVLDASVAVKIVSEEQDSDAAVRRVAYAGSVIAPDWMVLETAHALWKKVQAEQFDQSAAEAGIAALPQIVDRFVSSMSLM
ncbi:type II toxin-antitoxin system VapC family toxin, partial [Enterococcus faecium]